MASPSVIGKGTASAVTTGSATPSLPSGVQSNDILYLLVISHQPVSVGTISTPTDWTEAAQGTYRDSANTTDQGRAALFWRRALSAETGTVSVSRTGDTGTDGCFYAQIYNVRGCLQAGAPYDAVAAHYGPGNGTVNYDSVTVSAAGRTLLAFTAQADNASTVDPPTNYTGVTTDTTTTGTDAELCLCYRENQSSGSSTTATGGETEGWATFHVSAAPAELPARVGAIRFGASSGSDGLTNSSPVSPNTSTRCGWLRFRVTNVGSGRQMNAWSIEDANGTQTEYQLFETTYNANTMEVHDANQGGFLFSPTMLVDEWWFFAIANNRGTPNTKFYYKKEGWDRLSMTEGNDYPNFAGTAARFIVGTDDANDQNEWWDGDIAGLKGWAAELTEAELNDEARSLAPVRTANLHYDYRLQTTAAMLDDSSGNSRSLTKIDSTNGSWSERTDGPAITAPTISFVGAGTHTTGNNVTTLTTPVHASTASGDFLLFVCTDWASAPTGNASSWTLVNATGGNYGQHVYWGIATGTGNVTANVLDGYDDGEGWITYNSCARVFTFHGVASSSAVDAFTAAWAYDATASAVRIGSALTSTATGDAVVFLSTWGGSLTAPTAAGGSATNFVSGGNAAAGSILMAYGLDIGATGTETAPTMTTASASNDTLTLLIKRADSSVTGTLTRTLGAVTCSASGTSAAPSVTGTVARTLAAVTSSATGTAAQPGFSGSVAATLGAVTAAASGVYSIGGSVAATLAAVTAAASGAAQVTGTVARTLGAVVSTSTGIIVLPEVTGTVANTLGAVTSTASGTCGDQPPLYTDNFNGLTTATPLAGNWKAPSGQPVYAYAGTSVKQPDSGSHALGISVYQQSISANQYSKIQVTAGSVGYLRLRVRSTATSNVVYYECTFDDGGTGDWVASFLYCKGASNPTVLQTGAFTPGSYYRFEAASVNATSPVRLRLYVDTTLVLEAWDTTNPIGSGWPGFSLLMSGVGSATADNWSAGELDVPPTPISGDLPSGLVSISGNIGAPVAVHGDLPGKALSISGNIGAPFSTTGDLPSKALSMSAALGVFISKAKASTVLPVFTAFGGTDSYTGLTKGQISSDGDQSIGYRVGIGNDGTSGDRVMLKVPAVNLLRADTPSDPVACATLHVTMLTCMSWDYYAGAVSWTAGTKLKGDVVSNGGHIYYCRTAGTSVSGPSANSVDSTDGGTAHWRRIGPAYSPAPSGTAFNVRKADDPALGMSATLTGSYGTIAAKPIWLSGQTWYDGVTRASPIEEVVVDITTLYNESSQAGTDLNLCLECAFTDRSWVAELVGVDSNIAWGRPRIEVQRWGAVNLSLSNLSTCTPTVNVSPAAGTVSRVQWGYDQQLTPQGGVFKYLPSGEGILPSPYKLPMLETSSRVHVEVEVDYGVAGSLIFKRSWKTPQVFDPLVEANTTDYAWLDVRGPVNAPHTGSGDAWYAFVKRAIPAWAATHAYARGDVVSWSGSIYYAKSNFTSGSTSPVADGTWSVSTNAGTPGDYWGLWRLTTQSDTFVPHVGSFDSSNWNGGYNPLPFPTQTAVISISGADYILLATSGMDLQVDDISEPWADPTTGSIHFLTAEAGNTGYDVRLSTIWHHSGGEVNWGQNNFAAGVQFTRGSVIYNASTLPDLAATGAVTRAQDWRNCLDHDPYTPTLVAFVADGSLRIFANRTQALGNGTSPYGQTHGNPSGTWVSDNTPATVSNIQSVRFHHLLTRAGVHHTALSAVGTGTSWVGCRTDDSVTFNDGGGFTQTAGAWVSFTSSNVARVWATETIPYGSIGKKLNNVIGPHAPDDHSVALAIQLTDGTTTFRRPGTLTVASGGDPILAPAADFPAAAHTYNVLKRFISKWPLVPSGGYQVDAYTSNGGYVALAANSSALTAQRVQDYLRVSNTTSTTLASTIQEIHVQRDMLWEGQRVPVITKHSSGYRVSFLTVGVDLHRLYFSNPDQRTRFKSGKLTTANIVQYSPNQRMPAEFEHLAGNNCFSTGWNFDRQSDGSYVINPSGMMNEGGFNYLCFTNCQGERIKLLVYDVPGSGGKWREGALAQPTPDASYQPECLGGNEWSVQKMSTWWFTNDAPSVSPRRWDRVLETDYVLDGDSGGGLYVISIQSAGTNLWLANDLVSDVDTWRGDIAAWRSADAAKGWIKWVSTNGKGELLNGVATLADPSAATKPLSQVHVMP